MARKDIAKAMGFPDAYYTRGKAHLKRLEGMIKWESGVDLAAFRSGGRRVVRVPGADSRPMRAAWMVVPCRIPPDLWW